MPNLKISRRNTIQATGCQSLEALSVILYHLAFHVTRIEWVWLFHRTRMSFGYGATGLGRQKKQLIGVT